MRGRSISSTTQSLDIVDDTTNAKSDQCARCDSSKRASWERYEIAQRARSHPALVPDLSTMSPSAGRVIWRRYCPRATVNEQFDGTLDFFWHTVVLYFVELRPRSKDIKNSAQYTPYNSPSCMACTGRNFKITSLVGAC